MSASREKKKRQELLSGGSTDPRTIRKAEEEAKEKKSARMYTIGAVAFIVLAVVLVVYNSGIFQRNSTAVTIDGKNYTAAQASYYYGSSYNRFLNTYGNMASYIGLDTSKSLSSQAAWGSSDQTWDEYFKEQTVEAMKSTYAAKAAAEQADMSLDDTDMATFQETVDSLKAEAKSYGYSYKQYLTAVYGSLMTPSVYESCLKDSLLASKYSQDHYDSITFTDAEIADYYNEHMADYDLVDGAYVSISGAPETKTAEDGSTIEPTDEEKAAAMEEAKTTGEILLQAAKNGGDLEALAEEHGATYTGGTELTYSAGLTGDWLFADIRKVGDAELLEDADNSRWYVVKFNDRVRDDTPNYSVRHILINENSLDLPEGEEATSEQTLAKAQEILDSWDGTEEGFAALASEHTQDAGSKENGGLYEDVGKNDMVPAFSDWCYEDGRKPGDTGIVETNYGQHIMYFVGYTDTQYWHYAVENKMISDAYETWQEELTNSVTAETKGGMNAIGN